MPQTSLLRFGWPAALLFAAVAGTTLTACMMPFVAVAVVAAATLPVSRALLTLAAVWSVNQALGFCVLGYPRTPFAIGWGIAMLGAALAALAIARLILRPHPSRPDLIGSRLLLASLVAFGSYEALLYLYAGSAGGRETFTLAITLRIAGNEALWVVALVVFRLILARAAPTWFGPRLALRPV